MVEYQIILNVYVPQQGGRTVKSVVRSSDRDSAVKKFKYLDELLKNKNRQQELRQWSEENLNVAGVVTSIDGLYGVSYIKILP